jgi:hypothetical protein
MDACLRVKPAHNKECLVLEDRFPSMVVGVSDPFAELLERFDPGENSASDSARLAINRHLRERSGSLATFYLLS